MHIYIYIYIYNFYGKRKCSSIPLKSTAAKKNNYVTITRLMQGNEQSMSTWLCIDKISVQRHQSLSHDRSIGSSSGLKACVPSVFTPTNMTETHRSSRRILLKFIGFSSVITGDVSNPRGSDWVGAKLTCLDILVQENISLLFMIHLVLHVICWGTLRRHIGEVKLYLLEIMYKSQCVMLDIMLISTVKCQIHLRLWKIHLRLLQNSISVRYEFKYVQLWAVRISFLFCISSYK